MVKEPPLFREGLVESLEDRTLRQLNELLAKGEDMGEEEAPEMVMWSELLDTYRKLKALKPDERSEKARRMAVAITKYEDMLSWYFLMVSQEFVG